MGPQFEFQKIFNFKHVTMLRMKTRVEEDLKASLHEQKEICHNFKGFPEKITSI